MVSSSPYAATILRVFLGLAFFLHGLDKFRGGIGNTASFFESLGIPGFMASVVAGLELVGGIAMLLGIGTRVVAVFFALIMVVGTITAKLPAGFLGGYELEVALLAMSLYFAIGSRSGLALDNVLVRTAKG